MVVSSVRLAIILQLGGGELCLPLFSVEKTGFLMNKAAFHHVLHCLLFRERNIFACWVIFLLIFFRINFFKIFFRVSNGLDLGPDLGQYCLQRISADS